MSKSKSVMGVHASYMPSKVRARGDMTLVKERHKLEDGTIDVRLRYFEDYVREFYVTKPKFQKHKSKKEWEKISKCQKYKSTQVNLPNVIAKALNKRKSSLRRLANSPYLYNADIHVTTLILHKYIEAYGEPEMLPTVGVMDYEWDTVTKSPIIGTYIFDDKVYMTIRRDVIEKQGYTDESFKKVTYDRFYAEVVPLVDEWFDRKGNKKIERSNFRLDIEVVDLDLDVVRNLFRHTHTTMPDYLAFWNGISDMDVIFPLCESYSVDPADFMCDPSCPPEYRKVVLNRGMVENVDVNGKSKPKAPSQQWHTVSCLASWQFIDIQCAYRANRAHLPDLPSYAMDYVLSLELGMGKLKLVPELDGLAVSAPARWHNEMYTKHIVDYALYAQFDVIGPALLERKSFEIRAQAYSNININPLGDFPKNPRKLCNAQHFECMKRGYVIGTTGTNMREEFDDLVYSGDSWIVTLNSSYHDGLGAKALEDSTMETLYVPNNADGDLTSAYPSNQRLLNISRATRVTEVVKVDTIPEPLMREIGMNLSSNGDNGIDILYRTLNFKHLSGIVAAYDESVNASSDDKMAA